MIFTPQDKFQIFIEIEKRYSKKSCYENEKKVTATRNESEKHEARSVLDAAPLPFNPRELSSREGRREGG